MHLKGSCQIHSYQLSPHVYVEFFDEDAVMLVADRDLIVTVNHTAAKLFAQARNVAGSRLFNRSDCVNFLLDHYQLPRREAEVQMCSLLGFALKHGMVVRHTAS